MDAKSPIGVIDSGVGGLTVLRCLQKNLPHENFLYLGDTARTPYGTRSRAELVKMVAEMTAWLSARHIKQLVVACNTITVLGLDVIKGNHSFQIVGTSKGAKLALAHSKNKRIGVFATDFTVSTQAHKKAIQAVDPTAQVFAQGCTRFVPLIEHECFGSAALDSAIKEYAAPLKAQHIDTLLLSCTHYPFVKSEVEKVFGPEVTVLDPAEATVQDTLTALQAAHLAAESGAGHCQVCFTADLDRGKRLAGLMLDLKHCSFEQAKLTPA